MGQEPYKTRDQLQTEPTRIRLRDLHAKCMDCATALRTTTEGQTVRVAATSRMGEIQEGRFVETSQPDSSLEMATSRPSGRLDFGFPSQVLAANGSRIWKTRAVGTRFLGTLRVFTVGNIPPVEPKNSYYEPLDSQPKAS